MANYTEATVTLYAAEADLLAETPPTPVKTVTTSNALYLMENLEADDYFYTITGSTKGNILEFITVPDDTHYDITNNPDNRDGVVNLTIYPAAVETTITVEDINGDPIVGTTLKVQNYPYASDTPLSDSTFSLSTIPRIPTGTIIEFIGTGLQPMKIKRGFPVTGNAIGEGLYPEIILNVRFWTGAINTGTNVTNQINKATFYYTDETNLTGENAKIGSDIIINKASSLFTIPATIAYNGKLYLKSVTPVIAGTYAPSAVNYVNVYSEETGTITINYLLGSGILPD